VNAGTHVIIVAPGSRGHVDPCVGLGVGLSRAGYRVTVAADAAFGGLVTAAGLGLRTLAGDIRAAALASPYREETNDQALSRGKIAAARVLRNYMRQVNLALPDLVADADILLAGELGAAAYHLGQATGVPSMGVHVAPTHGTEDRETPAARPVHSAERLYFDGINEIRAGYGLPPTDPLQTSRRQDSECWPICFGFSSHVVDGPSAWREGLEMVGYWWPYVSQEWSPPAELTDFIAAGPPPVFVGFGSMVPGDPVRLSAAVAGGLRQAGQRGIVQAGWADLNVQGDDLLTIGDVPYEWLFPRVAAVVHAAGAGVTACGLRAGRPAIPVPYTSPDQPYWADRLTAIGISPTASLRLRTLTGEQLGDAIRAAVADGRCRRRAHEIAALINAEDGVAGVLARLKRIGQ
jgi:sterol 3beta-glucosyltransferase